MGRVNKALMDSIYVIESYNIDFPLPGKQTKPIESKEPCSVVSLPSYHNADNLIDIDLYSMPMADEPAVGGSGSGNDEDDDDGSPDDEDVGGSGSGSGMGVPVVTEPTVPTTTSKPLTPCEQLRRASKDLIGNYVPRCTVEGDYDTMQCRGYPGTGDCWCSDLDGRMIPSTNMEQPNVPDCELGSNLRPCVFEIVKFSRTRLLGGKRPKCTVEGYFQPVQCEGSMCYCATPYGKKIEGTEVFIHDKPNCQITETTLMPIKNLKTTAIATTPRVVIEEIITTKKIKTNNQGKTSKPEPETEYTESPNDNTNIKPLPEDNGGIDLTDSDEPDTEENNLVGPVTHIMTQPGLLAAIIGGAVVTLLCAILLIMFIVYRMRKKDEGSYALDEPRKMPNYSYHRAEKDKEFYA
ncbi:hypothetical protein LOTGIDRAFT_235646 [Lottia gigantea]|uniref:Syndecan n=1 Tax=Lottia gigantea TaxID=225164 RepID=V3ZU12_LOTGI|nr:hypothetical protein LOTGIDRAFT_235646 [Lottia gigantea]ESO86070.1 hypothetical protein LOTGIDRAFT_235646 [Lottia gigantea]